MPKPIGRRNKNSTWRELRRARWPVSSEKRDYTTWTVREEMDNYRDRTKIAFGAIEAYAKGYLRVAPISGMGMRLSLQDARGQRPASSPLLRLRDGDPLDPGELSALLPSIGSVTWEFSATQTVDGPQLVAVADGIRVTLSMNDADELNAARTEAQLRGAAARLVVAICYGE